MSAINALSAPAVACLFVDYFMTNQMHAGIAKQYIVTASLRSRMLDGNVGFCI